MRERGGIKNRGAQRSESTGPARIRCGVLGRPLVVQMGKTEISRIKLSMVWLRSLLLRSLAF